MIKICKTCQQEFQAKRRSKKYCSTLCKTKNNQLNGSMSTKEQYLRISGNWEKYFARLASFHNRQVDGLTKADLLDVYNRQQGVCALSGIKLTCLLGHGKIKTNASVDRIQAGGPYVRENIQLVCGALNKFRDNTTAEEFIWWCQRVTAFQKDKECHT